MSTKIYNNFPTFQSNYFTNKGLETSKNAAKKLATEPVYSYMEFFCSYTKYV